MCQNGEKGTYFEKEEKGSPEEVYNFSRRSFNDVKE